MLKLNYRTHNLKDGSIRVELNVSKENTSIAIKSDEQIVPLLKTLALSQIDQITSLKITDCYLTTLPNDFCFVNLTELDVSCNKIREIPTWLFYCNLKLQCLNLSHNCIESFDVAPKFSKFLRELNLSANQLKKIPVWLYSSSFIELERLDLSLNPFQATLSFLNGRCLRKLKYLKMNNCLFKKDYIRLLKQIPLLEKLSISNNKYSDYLNHVEEIPFNTFSSVANLTEINLSGLSSSVLIDEISLLSKLVKLDISHNYVSWLPKNITKLTSLKILNASHNELLYIPNDIDKLVNLTELHVSDNIIGVLPESIYKLTNLEVLDCYNNDLVVKLATVLHRIPSLKALDLEQNGFVTSDEPSYLEKRAFLRQNLTKRHNGLKFSLENLSDDNYSDKSWKSNDYDVEDQGGISETIQVEQKEENWECDEFDTDDYLVLPPFRLQLAARRTVRSDPVDPECFADSPDDQT